MSPEFFQRHPIFRQQQLHGFPAVLGYSTPGDFQDQPFDKLLVAERVRNESPHLIGKSLGNLFLQRENRITPRQSQGFLTGCPNIVRLLSRMLESLRSFLASLIEHLRGPPPRVGQQLLGLLFAFLNTSVLAGDRLAPERPRIVLSRS